MLRKSLWLAACLTVCGLLFLTHGAEADAGIDARGYDYYLTGNSADAPASTTPGLVLAGGGTDVDEAMLWLLQRSDGGDIMIIRTSGSDGYNQYLYDMAPVDSVETFVFKTRTAATKQSMYDKLMTADALFIAGGDQYDYIRKWKGTLVEQAIHDLLARGVPVGGTSAGLAILGDVIYSAANGTVYSDEALANPYNRYMTFEPDFLNIPLLANLITDTHFAERDRMGRLVAFVARLMQDGLSNQARGVGVSEQTAVLVEPDGSARVVGAGSAYFLHAPGMPERCQPRQTLTYLDVPVYRLSAGPGTFDLNTWTGNGGLAYTVSAQNGNLTASKPGGPY